MSTVLDCVLVALLSPVVINIVSAQTIRVEPRFTTMDRQIAIHISGLPPGQRAHVRATSVDEAGRLWISSLPVSANARGMAELATRPDGGVTRRDASDLLTSMTVRGEETPVSRFEVSWRDTVVTVISLDVGGRIVVGDTLRRTFGSPDVLISQIREQGMVGTLFEHRDGAKRPAILVIGGSEGGDGAADLAYQLSGHGYTTLSLAYFGVDPLPAQLEAIPIEYFLNTLKYLRALPSVRSDRVGIVATSKGAEAALLVAARDPGIAAVAAFAPTSVVWSCICDSVARSSWSFHGLDIASVPPGRDPSYTKAAPIRPAVNYSYRMRSSPTPAAIIDAASITAPVYLVAGGDDGLWPSAKMAREIYGKLSPRSLRAGSRLTVYPDAGHLIGKSLLPAGSTLIARGRIDTGGTPAANADAGRDAWPRVLAFLEKTLSLTKKN